METNRQIISRVLTEYHRRVAVLREAFETNLGSRRTAFTAYLVELRDLRAKADPILASLGCREYGNTVDPRD